MDGSNTFVDQDAFFRRRAGWVHLGRNGFLVSWLDSNPLTHPPTL